MEDFDPCSVCGDEGLYFCRSCSLRYCHDHLCLHLSVAWENNSWTKRHSPTPTEFNFGANSNENERSESDSTRSKNFGQGSPRINWLTNSDLSLGNEKALTAYTEPQLQAQLNFYISQSRRIKRELERRAIPSAGFSFGGENQLLSRRQQKQKDNPSRTRKVPISVRRASEVLADGMRNGSITVEQIRNALEKK